ncbi:MAG: 4-hydroxyphenylpyruvate dioxygenase [Paraglaciecola sp.]
MNILLRLRKVFRLLKICFAEVAQHRSKRVWLFKQGGVNFIVNAEPASQAEEFARLRGPSVCGVAFRVKDAIKPMEHATKSGAKQFVGNLGAMEANIPAVYGIVGSTLSDLSRKYRDQSEAKSRDSSHFVDLYEDSSM